MPTQNSNLAAHSPLAQYAEDEEADSVLAAGEREVDLVKVIEGLLRRVGDLEVELRALRRPH